MCVGMSNLCRMYGITVGSTYIQHTPLSLRHTLNVVYVCPISYKTQTLNKTPNKHDIAKVAIEQYNNCLTLVTSQPRISVIILVKYGESDQCGQLMCKISTITYSILHYLTVSYIILHCLTLSDSILQYPTLSYIILQYLSLSYIILHYLTLSYIILQYLTLSYIILHYLTLSYSFLHYLTLSYSILHYLIVS